MTDRQQSPAIIGSYYDTLLREHGDNAQGAGWPNEADRQTRFGVMRDLAWSGGPLGSLCDVACGTGAFLTYLQDRDAAPARYLGVDLSSEAIALARMAHPGQYFVVTDILQSPLTETFDHVVANGLFTVKSALSEPAMWDFMTSAVAAMWAMTGRAMAFNVMSAVVDWRRDDLFHVEVDRLLAFLHTLAGRRVVVRADYDLYEYTAYVYRHPVDKRG